MSNSLNVTVLELYRAILTDCATQFSWKAREAGNLFARLSSLVENRGLRVLTIDFPEGGKFLERSLERGFISDDFPNVLGYRCPEGPRLFLALFELIFDKSGSLRDDYSVEAVFFLRQIFYAVKKLRLECAKERLYATTSAFAKVEDGLPHPTLQWDEDSILHHSWDNIALDHISLRDRSPECVTRVKRTIPLPFGRDTSIPGAGVRLLDITQRVADVVAVELGYLDPWEIMGRHGPGAVSDGSQKDWKYIFPTWGEKLNAHFPWDWHGIANTANVLDGFQVDGGASFLAEEVPSRLISVPKTQKAPRLIASEPTSHQWIQQGLADWLRLRVASRDSSIRSSIDLLDQGKSRAMCLTASRTRRSATVDLSEASDRLSCWVVERAFRKNRSVILALHAARTRLLQNPIDKKIQRVIPLRKFAAMGSAVTFPVQTIVFTIMACAAVIALDDRPVSAKRIRAASRVVRVYGDDIIIPVRAYENLCSILKMLFLKVNEAKSFVKGPFRESCGMDAVGGFSVTPAYFLQDYEAHNPESVASVVEASNNFHKVGCWATSDFLMQRIPVAMRRLIPIIHPRKGWISQPTGGASWVRDVVAGHGVSLSFLSYSGTVMPPITRWNDQLHREESRTLVLRTKTRIRKMDSVQSLLQYYTEAPEADEFGFIPAWSSGLSSRPTLSLASRWVPSA